MINTKGIADMTETEFLQELDMLQELGIFDQKEVSGMKNKLDFLEKNKNDIIYLTAEEKEKLIKTL